MLVRGTAVKLVVSVLGWNCVDWDRQECALVLRERRFINHAVKCWT